MKLYRGTTKRLAKKKLRKYWRKLQRGINLKAGDLFTSCRGFNERIISIVPIWDSSSKIIIDL